MSRQTSRRRAWTGIWLTLGVVALSAGAWGLREWAPFGDGDGEVVWPENIQPIADFVEEVTGFRFREAVTVEYVSGVAKYEDYVSAPADEPTNEEIADAELSAAAGRALGYWSRDVSLLDYDSTLASRTPGPVTWLGSDNLIVVRAAGPDGALTATTRAELAAALTEALDEQLFGVVERAFEAKTQQEYHVLNGLLVGHASWVRDQYVGDMDPADEESYYDNIFQVNGSYVEKVDDVPVSFRAIRSAGVALGTAFMAVIAEDPDLVERAFTSDVPDALDQLMLPTTKYLRRDPLEVVEAPPAPDGSEAHYTLQLGPLGLFMMMSTGLDARDALTAADGWGNDAYTVYTLDGVVCLDAHVVADSPDDADRIEAGLNAWGTRRKAESGALLGRDGVNLYFSVCDPGEELRFPTPQEEAIDHFFGRSGELANRINLTRKPTLSECIAVRLYEEFDQDQLLDRDFDFEIADDIAQIEEDCLDQE